MSIVVQELSGAEGWRHVPALAAVLLDCVEGGASVSFMATLERTEAEAFFASVVDAAEKGERILLAAFLDDHLVGTVQMVPAVAPNQPHRADIAKLLVLRSARGQGAASLLMRRVEEVSRREGRTLLVLDTVTGGTAEKLYERIGWNRVGVIPDYALFPDGSPCDTTVFWKKLN